MTPWSTRNIRAVCVALLSVTALSRAQSQRVATDMGSSDTNTQAAAALSTRIASVDVDSVSLTRAVDLLAERSGVHVQYERAVLEQYTAPITLHLRNVALGVALERALAKTTLRVVPLTRNSVGIVEANQLPALGQGRRVQGGVIAGTVTDSGSGRGLGGATVRVVGTKVAALTSDSGHFVLKDVPTGDQLLSIKLFGYRPAERTVTVVDSERTTIRIQLVSVPTVLSGVVTTASGQQRKVEVGNDITTLNVDSIQRVAPITSVTDLLETRVPGLTVMHTSGIPGDPSRLRLRGAGSISENNDPIVIVDGIRVYASQSDPRNDNLAKGVGGTYAAPSPIDQIDPNNIETIEVFKGPSASALYGSDAANGVIVITTKHGRGGPTQWSVNLGTGINWIPGSWPVNYYQFGYDQSSERTVCYFYMTGCMVDSIVAFQALNDPTYTILSHGSDQTANLNISGGVSNLTYNLTGSAAGDVGNLKLPGVEEQRYEQFYGPVPSWMVRPDNYQTWSLGGTMTAQPHPGFNVTLQSTLFNSNQQRSSLQSALSTLSATFISGEDILSDAGNAEIGTTPLINGEVERATDNSLTSTNALSLNWSPRLWLPINIVGGLNTIQRTDVTYVPYGVNFATFGSSSVGDTTGSYGLGRGTSRVQTLSAATTVPLFAQRVTMAFGANLYDESTNDFSAYTDQLAPGVSTPTTFLVAANAASCCTQSTTNASTYGWYFEPRWNISQRFFLTPGFRLDGGSGGSTSSGSIDGLSAFPKISLSYLAVDQPTGHPLGGVITQLRPRFTFGLAGTQPSPSDKLRLFNVGAYQDSLPGQGSLTTTGGCSDLITLDGGATYVPSVCLSSLGNTQLRPERSSELEGGFDVNLWDSRVQLTYTQYNKTRHDAIVTIPVAASLAGNAGTTFNIAKNIGVVRNTGTEATMNLELLRRRAMTWAIGANLTSDQNKVIRLNAGETPIELDGGCVYNSICSRIVAGYPLDGRWARPILAYTDANHDGIIEPNEIQLRDSAVYVGEQTPNYQLNLTSDLTLFNGRLGIHVTVAYENGLSQYDDLSQSAFLLLNNGSSVPLATQAALVAASCGDIYQASQCASLQGGSLVGLVQTVSTLRFNDLSVNYEVPRTVSNWFRVPHMEIDLQGSNLGLHSNYRGKDPDVNAFSTVNVGDLTEDSGEIPEPRTWWLKIRLFN